MASITSGIESIIATINGAEYTLSKQPDGSYATPAVAPSLSSGANNSGIGVHVGGSGGYYDVKLTIRDYAGNELVVDSNSPGWGDILKLKVYETSRPAVAFIDPQNNAHLGDKNYPIHFRVSDIGSGVNPDSIKVGIKFGGQITWYSEGITKTGSIAQWDCEYYLPSVNDGINQIIVNASDYDGNTYNDDNAPSIQVMVDTKAPDLVVNLDNVVHPDVYEDDDYTTNLSTIRVYGIASDANGVALTITHTLPNGENLELPQAIINSEYSCELNLQEGMNIITAVARDSFRSDEFPNGRTTTVVKRVILDTVPPTIRNVVLNPNPVVINGQWRLTIEVVDE